MRRPKDSVFPLRKALGVRKKNSAASRADNVRDGKRLIAKRCGNRKATVRRRLGKGPSPREWIR